MLKMKSTMKIHLKIKEMLAKGENKKIIGDGMCD